MHHASTPFYDPENVVELQGAVTRFVFRNPHAFLFLDVEGEEERCLSGKLVWCLLGVA